MKMLPGCSRLRAMTRLLIVIVAVVLAMIVEPVVIRRSLELEGSLEQLVDMLLIEQVTVVA